MIVLGTAPRFVKLDAKEKQLPVTAKKWVGVLDLLINRIWDPKEYAVCTHEEATAKAAAIVLCGKPALLPDDQELILLPDRSRKSPAIDTTFFPKCRSDWYWTSRISAWSAEDAWFVGFGHGYAITFYRDGHASVRAVRPCQ